VCLAISLLLRLPQPSPESLFPAYFAPFRKKMPFGMIGDGTSKPGAQDSDSAYTLRPGFEVENENPSNETGVVQSALFRISARAASSN
jgi:hypothetical protein